MTSSSGDEGISDDLVPEDLQPGEDNPLAEPLDPGETSEVDLNEPSQSYARETEERGREEPDDEDDSGASDEE
jgi:hypothetical protein